MTIFFYITNLARSFLQCLCLHFPLKNHAILLHVIHILFHASPFPVSLILFPLLVIFQYLRIKNWGKGAYQPGDLSLIPRTRAKTNGENWLHKVVLSDWNPLSSKDVRKRRMSFHQQKAGIWIWDFVSGWFWPLCTKCEPLAIIWVYFFAKKQNYSTWCYCPTLYWCHYHISLC